MNTTTIPIGAHHVTWTGSSWSCDCGDPACEHIELVDAAVRAFAVRYWADQWPLACHVAYYTRELAKTTVRAIAA